MDDRPAAEDRYAGLLREMRYRSGVLDGYPSRLHYFSEWIADNARRGLLVDLGGELGGVIDREPIDFMSTHPDAYRQLSRPENLRAHPGGGGAPRREDRVYVPEEAIPDVADRIRNGDVIAATSTVPGLDIAHTGLALWIDGRLHLLPRTPSSARRSKSAKRRSPNASSASKARSGLMIARPQGR
ncbi:MAG: DUF1460 domain-containing protein [Gemmatimonadota bacterium]|nr:DUF1460 domain-containing protein [Gemmatimonadota bacterium]